MTNRELSWWLHEHPEEHREYMFKDNWISSHFNYNVRNAEEEVSCFILIRSNGGEWEDPLFNEVEKIKKEERKQFNVKDYISDIKTPLETRDGRAVQIKKFEINISSPILTDYIEGFVEGNSDIITWNGKGRFSIIGEESEYDLFFKTLGKSNDKRN